MYVCEYEHAIYMSEYVREYECMHGYECVSICLSVNCEFIGMRMSMCISVCGYV